MDIQLPKPPPITRRVGAPAAVALGLLALGAAPALALAGVLPKSAATPTINVSIVFVTLIAVFRLLGKRELGRLSPFDLVTLMLVPEILSDAVQGQNSLVDSLVGLSTLLFMVFVTSVLANRFQFVETAVEPSPTVLVANGRMISEQMNRERIQPEELFAEMRKQGLEHLSQVKWAVLEASGNINFVPESPPGIGSQGSSSNDLPR